jgi:hypothetical protein
MMRLVSTIALGLMVLTLSFCPAQAATNPLELVLSADQMNYKEGDPIRLKLEFTNSSTNPLILYSGLLPDYNLNMDIARIDGGEKKLSWPRRLYERSQPRKDEFVTIPPYTAHKDHFYLQDYMDEHVKLLGKGKYKLTVRYSNDIDGYQEYQPYSFIKMNAWKGKIASNTVTITIQ